MLAVGCARPSQRPTISGAQLYAQLPALLLEGQVMVDAPPPVNVRTDQVLVTPDRTQMFDVQTLVANCPASLDPAEPVCMLAALRDLRFEVHDTPPIRDLPKPAEEPSALGYHGTLLVVALAIAAPLTYGVATCEFDGCKAIFGLGLTFDALGLLVLAIGFR